MNWKKIDKLYQNEINFFQKKIDRIFFDIVTLETKISEKKEQKLKQDEKDLDRLFKMIVLFLENIACSNTYEYFKMKKILLVNENLLLFRSKMKQHFENILQILMLKIKNEEEKEEKSIDFTIN